MFQNLADWKILKVEVPVKRFLRDSILPSSLSLLPGHHKVSIFSLSISSIPCLTSLNSQTRGKGCGTEISKTRQKEYKLYIFFEYFVIAMEIWLSQIFSQTQRCYILEKQFHECHHQSVLLFGNQSFLKEVNRGLLPRDTI